MGRFVLIACEKAGVFFFMDFFQIQRNYHHLLKKYGKSQNSIANTSFCI